MYSDPVGKHIHHKKLTYKQAVRHAVTAWSGHIVVAEQCPPALHIYTDRGKHVASKTHEQLGLDKNASVSGIRCDSDGVLHVCVGSTWEAITSLHAFKVYTPCSCPPYIISLIIDIFGILT